MTRLLGQGDDLLRLIEDQFESDIAVRGNQITISGGGHDSQTVSSLFAEMIQLIERGEHLTPESLERSIELMRHGDVSPTRAARRRHPHAQGQGDPAQDRRPEALRRRHPQEHRHVRHRPCRHRQDLPRDGDGRRGAQAQGGRPHHPHASGRRGRRVARLPARHAHREGRPVPAPALRRALRHDGRREVRGAARARHHRDRAARLHARPHAQRQLRHPRRGAEHQPRADEDVPDAARVRVEVRHHRRRHADRPAEGRVRASGRCATSSTASPTSSSAT